jgi:uncharacterized protein (TIGR02246 family)
MISPEDEAAIGQLGGKWDRAWNTHDVHALALLVTTNVDFIHVLGGWPGGRDAFEKYHSERHAAQFRASVTRTRGMTIRSLTRDICLVHRNWTMQGDTDANGVPRPPRSIWLQRW